MPSPKPVVLILATHPILRNAICESLLLMQPDWEYLEAADLARALAFAASRPIDIALVDGDLAGATGLEAMAALRSAAPQARVVALTDAEDTAAPAAYLRAGACACVRKRSLFAELQPLLPRLMEPPPLR